MRRAVVTGLGALTPLGNDIKSYWDGLISGKSGAAPITYFDTTNFKTQFACEVKNFDPSQHFDRRESKRLDPYMQYGLVAGSQAMEDSGIDVEKINLDRAGVIWASGIGGLRTLEDEVGAFATGNGMPRYNPFLVPKMIADGAGNTLSIKYGFRGISYATVSACASSTNAISIALDYIRMNKADIFIAGGSEATICPTGVGGFNAMKAMSTRNDSPETASRPFDAERDGFVLGEGAGALVIEEYEHARKRGATIYAELCGSAMTSDAYHITAPHPEGRGAAAVMDLAVKDAQMNPESMSYVNVHGTSTPLGDVAEIKAIQKVFGDHAYNMNIGSTKSMTGHLLGAAGAIEAIAAILSTKYNIVPPTINHFTDDPDIDSKLNLTFNSAQEREINVALSNTFGFGGHNASVIFSKLK
ncbi:MAG: beta-ketoacyl-ACP synthase II [Bacteroidia bacterium]|nr:beta-ketoacyl-ACP synthase II [Bacteroidia bacterium]